MMKFSVNGAEREGGHGSGLRASFGGARSFCGMKHVGLNVAADPLFTMSYIGVNAGMVIGVADDPGMHSSQNEQDSRNYAIAAKLPMLEPSDSSECRDFTKLAYRLSEQFDTPVLLRLSTRVSHSRSIVELEDREERPLLPYHKDPSKNVMLPVFATKKHAVVEKRTVALAEWAETAEINRVEDNGSDVGVIAAGSVYTYAREALGDTVSYLKLGMVNPLPERLIRDFASRVKKLYVIEELDDVLETFCRKIGVPRDRQGRVPALRRVFAVGHSPLRAGRGAGNHAGAAAHSRPPSCDVLRLPAPWRVLHAQKAWRLCER